MTNFEVILNRKWDGVPVLKSGKRSVSSQRAIAATSATNEFLASLTFFLLATIAFMFLIVMK